MAWELEHLLLFQSSRFSSQSGHDSSQPSLTPDTEAPNPSSNLLDTRYTGDTYTHMQENHSYIENTNI